jgi:ElaB/YqjD/DUF883 family membrane-anchored ribosome-binding protein
MSKPWAVAVIGILIGLVLGLMMIGIGGRRIRRAEEIQKRAESQLQIALDYAVRQAGDKAKDADDALRRNNWGVASQDLNELNELVSLMEQVAPEEKQAAVRQVRQALNDVQTAVGEQSQDARGKLDALRSALDGLGETR